MTLILSGALAIVIAGPIVIHFVRWAPERLEESLSDERRGRNLGAVDRLVEERSSLPLVVLLDDWEREGRPISPSQLAEELMGLPTTALSLVGESAYEAASDIELETMSREIVARAESIGAMTYGLREKGLEAAREGRSEEASRIANALRRIARDNRGRNKQLDLVAELADGRADLIEAVLGGTPPRSVPPGG